VSGSGACADTQFIIWDYTPDHHAAEQADKPPDSLLSWL
jgi:hypothetical protein